MRFTKALGIIAATACALMAFASAASATTFRIGTATQTSDVNFEASLSAAASLLVTDTFGVEANTCTGSNIKWSDSARTSGTTIEGPVSLLNWSGCSEGSPTVDAGGSISLERIGTTINGTVRWTGAKLTVPSFFGTLTCTTENTDMGTLTGTTNTFAHATIDINAVVSCTGIGTSKWSGTYTLTSPQGGNMGA
jgi:hypothetical protein